MSSEAMEQTKPVDSRWHDWYTEAEYAALMGWQQSGDGTQRAYVEFGADPDDGFNSSGPCGGPVCKTCGYHYCEHCHPDGPEEQCYS